MKINITKEQYECLIKALEAGNSVYGILGDSVSDDYKKQSNEMEDLSDYFLGFAGDFGMKHITEKYKEKIIITDEYSEKLYEVIDDYNDETFWNELIVRLGKRDFERIMTDEDKKEIIKNNGWLPEKIHKIYEKWREEFEENGIDRLGIVHEK